MLKARESVRELKEYHPPLGNLYVSMLQRMGVEVDQFASGKGTLPELEMT